MISKSQTKKYQRTRRHARIRAKISGTAKRPRLAVFKSNRYIYAELINDDNGTTIASATSKTIKKGTPTEKAKAVGQTIAEKAIEKKIKEVVFDRGGFLYAGHIKVLADGAREGGLSF